jgi:hypothetical protein
MNNFIKQVIEEKFASKAQQRYFYAQAGKGGKKGKKWAKWAKEFSDKTDFEKIPDKVDGDTEIEEIVDVYGNFSKTKTPLVNKTKGINQKKTTDAIVKSGGGSMGIHGVHGTHTSLRYWAENKQELKKLIENTIDEIEMKDALGYDETMGQDASYDEAEEYFKNELDLPDDEAEDRLKKMGYDEKLPDGKIRIVENPKKFIEEFIESIIAKRNNDNDILKNTNVEINPIIKRQLNSLKETMKKNNLSINDILEYLKDYE